MSSRMHTGVRNRRGPAIIALRDTRAPCPKDFGLLLGRRKEFFVLGVPYGFHGGPSGKGCKVRDELTHAHLGTRFTQLAKCLKQFASGRSHGKRSPTVGKCAQGVRSSPISSAWILIPGRNFAARVARVTPSLIMSAPSDPRYTKTGGIPSKEIP